jgi:hypothetical protein
MLLWLIPFTFSVKVISPVDLSDSVVVSMQSCLNSALPFLFPDAYGVPKIFQAEKEGFISYSLTLSIKMIPGVRFQALVSVNSDGKPDFESFTGLPSSKNPGGYHWQDPGTLTEVDLNLLKTLLAKQERFTGSIKKILAYRVQIVAGTKQHFIFKDDRGELYAAVLTKSPEIGERITYFVNPLSC